MLYAASIIHYKSSKADIVKKAIAEFKNAEIFAEDDSLGKLVLTVEFETDSELQAIEDKLLKVDGVIDVLHHAFNFEEEVEKMAKGEMIIDLTEFSKMRDDTNERN